MSTPIKARDLTKESPHSPRERFGGFAILARTTDKCRASIAGSLGEFHYDCPLDNQLFGFKGITGAEFKTAVTDAQTYEDVARWLNTTGRPKTPEETKAWSDKAEATKLTEVPIFQDAEHRKQVAESCRKLGLDFQKATLFDWLEADDRTVSQSKFQTASK